MKINHLKTEEIDLLLRQGTSKVNSHLGSCPACQAAMEEAIFSKQSLKVLQTQEKAPLALRLKVQKILSERELRPSFFDLLFRALWVKPAFIMTTVILIAGSVLYWGNSSSLSSQKEFAEDPLSMEWAAPQQAGFSKNGSLAMLTDDLEEIAASEQN